MLLPHPDTQREIRRRKTERKERKSTGIKSPPLWERERVLLFSLSLSRRDSQLSCRDSLSLAWILSLSGILSQGFSRRDSLSRSDSLAEILFLSQDSLSLSLFRAGGDRRLTQNREEAQIRVRVSGWKPSV